MKTKSKRKKQFPLWCLLFLGLSSCQSVTKKEFTLGDEVFKVNVTSYKQSEQSKKSLLIMAPTGGVNVIDRSYAKRFADEGYHVYVLNSWTGDSEVSIDLGIHQRLYSRAQQAIGLVMSPIESPFIGMLGTSVGALHAAVSASQQNRLNAIFIIVGGAPITEVIVESDQSAMVKLRSQRLAKYGFTDNAQYLEALGKEFQLEPMQLGDGYKSKQLGMMISTVDTTVPTVFQRQLQKFWNPSVTLTYDSTHFWTIIKTWLFEDDTLVKFFEDSYEKSRYK